MFYINDTINGYYEIRDTENTEYQNKITYNELIELFKTNQLPNIYALQFRNNRPICVPLYLTYPYANFVYTHCSSKGVFADLGLIVKTGLCVQNYDDDELLEVYRNLKRAPLQLKHTYKMLGKTGIFGGVKLKNGLELHGFHYLPLRFKCKKNSIPYVECIETFSDFSSFTKDDNPTNAKLVTLSKLIEEYNKWINTGGEVRLRQELEQWYRLETNYNTEQIHQAIQEHFVLSPIKQIAENTYQIIPIRDKIQILDNINNNITKSEKLRLRLAYGPNVYDNIKINEGVLEYCEYNFTDKPSNAIVNIVLPNNIHTLTKHSVRIQLPSFRWNSQYTIKFPSSIKHIDSNFLKTGSLEVFRFDISDLDEKTQIDFISDCIYKGWWNINSDLEGIDFIKYYLQVISYTMSVFSKKRTIQNTRYSKLNVITKYNRKECIVLLDKVLENYINKYIDFDFYTKGSIEKVKLEPIKNIDSVLKYISIRDNFGNETFSKYIIQLMKLFGPTYHHTYLTQGTYVDLPPRRGTYYLLDKVYQDKLINLPIIGFGSLTATNKPPMMPMSLILSFCLGKYFKNSYTEKIYTKMESIVDEMQHKPEFKKLKIQIYGNKLTDYPFCADLFTDKK